VMARFGPKLPKLIEDLLNNQVNSSKQKQTSYKSKKTLNVFVMGAFFGTLVAIGLGLI